jgi:hypothetical protein
VVVTVKAFAKRYGVDRYTAYEDLIALGFAASASDHRWARRSVSAPRRRGAGAERERGLGGPADDGWTTLDSRLFFVADHTSNGAPYGVFAEEMPPCGDSSCRL